MGNHPHVRIGLPDGDHVTMTVSEGTVRMHDAKGDPECVTRVFPWERSRVDIVFGYARTGDELARLVRWYTQEMSVHALVRGRVSIKLTTNGGDWYLIHRDEDETVTILNSANDEARIGEIFKPAVTDAIRDMISTATTQSAMTDVIRPHLNGSVIEVEAFSPFAPSATVSRMRYEAALDIIEGMLEGSVEGSAAADFLLDSGRNSSISA